MNMRLLASWHLIVLLISCHSAKGDWHVNVDQWNKVRPSRDNIKTIPDATQNKSSDWTLDIRYPHPQSPRTPDFWSDLPVRDDIRFHIEQTCTQSLSSCNFILPEVATVIPEALNNVFKYLYTPPAPGHYHRGGPREIRNSFTPAPPEINSITISIDNSVVERGGERVAGYTEPAEPSSSHRKLHLKLDWFQQSLIDPKSWQSRRLLRAVLAQILTHELTHVYQHKLPASSYGIIRVKKAKPLPKGLAEGIATFVTLKSDLKWQGYQRPKSKNELPARWDYGYQHTAFFLLWLEEFKAGEGAVAVLNDLVLRDYYWGEYGNEDGGTRFWIELFGASPEVLWAEYIHYVEKHCSSHGKVRYLGRGLFDWSRYDISARKIFGLLKGSLKESVSYATPLFQFLNWKFFINTCWQAFWFAGANYYILQLVAFFKYVGHFFTYIKYYVQGLWDIRPLNSQTLSNGLLLCRKILFAIGGFLKNALRVLNLGLRILINIATKLGCSVFILWVLSKWCRAFFWPFFTSSEEPGSPLPRQQYRPHLHQPEVEPQTRPQHRRPSSSAQPPPRVNKASFIHRDPSPLLLLHLPRHLHLRPWRRPYPTTGPQAVK
ncbi:hypothetical protein N7532_008474 [Penicillium argentinense]|uniref:Uncharacterized protein n=1 Tax=Penicillium argentinense TaxID=1131581 RepID=A0A9W9K1X8_9EURO|nr:uncharacterized protein N7532_008474 [Penicillium argentinense]KAJ5089790.1 hypothetical protein N7532_008474 [Penicillium argentinense]